MAIRITGNLKPAVGQVKVKDLTAPLAAGWVINVTDTFANQSQVVINEENPLSLEVPGEYTLSIASTFGTPLTLKAWGAGAGVRGNGGFVSGTMTPTPGQTYKVWVGGPGRNSNRNIIGAEGGFGGGGSCGEVNSSTGNENVGSGGGLSGIFADTATHANSVLIAGGGGGGAFYSGGTGGNGGYTEGGNGTAAGAASGGLGGTQTAGGVNGTGAFNGGQPGSELQGGSIGIEITSSGGGGGGGYYGGGSGARNNLSGSAGGGGSSYYDPAVIGNFSFVNDVNSGDIHYANNASQAVGSNLPNHAFASPGLFVLAV